jgi:hypothetical protein
MMRKPPYAIIKGPKGYYGGIGSNGQPIWRKHKALARKFETRGVAMVRMAEIWNAYRIRDMQVEELKGVTIDG